MTDYVSDFENDESNCERKCKKPKNMYTHCFVFDHELSFPSERKSKFFNSLVPRNTYVSNTENWKAEKIESNSGNSNRNSGKEFNRIFLAAILFANKQIPRLIVLLLLWTETLKHSTHVFCGMINI